MHILIFFLFCAIFQWSTAQKNSYYLETLGNGGLGSINYERQLTNSPTFLFRIGAGVTRDNVGNGNELLSLPTSVHYLINLKNNNYLDFSAGVSWYDAVNEGPAKGVFHLFTGIGFRRNFSKNWFLRAHVSPYIQSLTKSIELAPENTEANYNGFTNFFVYSSSRKYYRYVHEDATIGFSIGRRF